MKSGKWQGNMRRPEHTFEASNADWRTSFGCAWNFHNFHNKRGYSVETKKGLKLLL